MSKLSACLAAAAALFLASPAAAVDLQTPPEIGGETWGAAAQLLASVERADTLVRTSREITVGGSVTQNSDLRVSLLVTNAGPSTDVSPRLEIHLAMFNLVNEWGTAWSVTPIASAWRVGAARRMGPGLYEIDAELLDYDGECLLRRGVISLDARQHSVKVRQAAGLGEFDSLRLRHPIAVTVTPGPCSEF